MMALGDHCAVLPDLVDGDVNARWNRSSASRTRAIDKAASSRRRTAGRGWQRIGRLAAALHLAAGVGDHPTLGQHVEEGRAGGGGPAVVAVMAGFGFDGFKVGRRPERRRVVGGVAAEGEEGGGGLFGEFVVAHATRSNLFGSCRTGEAYRRPMVAFSRSFPSPPGRPAIRPAKTAASCRCHRDRRLPVDCAFRPCGPRTRPDHVDLPFNLHISTQL